MGVTAMSVLSQRDVIVAAVLLIKTENKLWSVLVNNTADKMASHCDKSDVAQNPPIFEQNHPN
jgi:hypothetical protein